MTRGRSPRERLEEIQAVLEEMISRDPRTVILVEGMRDRGALTILGVGGEMVQVQSSDGVFGIAERLAKEGKSAVIMTDWDRKGGQLSRLLRSALEANAVPYDDGLRQRLVIVARQDIKDVQSLPSLYSRLVQEVQARDR
ncbi:MAG: Toprim subdomain protein [Methanomassiliicoccales archaeon]|jgi:dTMP kinase|nr:Toprim subdomain protein [Methanomassiliicoccales archaeon]MCE5261841.1 Toprim subdomain protein [Euryarchaeota archaeon]HPD08934.1 Toprim subdomain protein [Methanomassiliicoccales archaeon]HRU11514.1 Toprim subdomain protein [Methanomassiliicoccales archaeon]